MDDLDFMDMEIDSSDPIDEEFMSIMNAPVEVKRKRSKQVKVKKKKKKALVIKPKKKKRVKKPSDKGKEEEVPFSCDDEEGELEAMFADDPEPETHNTGLGDNMEIEEAEMEYDSSEERDRKKKELALRKLDKMKSGPKKSKGKKRKGSSPKEDQSIFPSRKDMLGLMAYIHSSGYTSICKGDGGGELNAVQKMEVDSNAFALANFFRERLNGVVARCSDAVKALISAQSTDTANAPRRDQLCNLMEAIRKYRRLVIPGGAYDKPDALCPFTLSKIDPDDSVRMVLIPDEEGSLPVVFYTGSKVAELFRTMHTLYHFGAYFRLDLEKVINGAKKSLEDGTEDPEIVWDALFNPMESVPKNKRDQQPGTRLIGLKQDLLSNLCKAMRAYVGDGPFKDE